MIEPGITEILCRHYGERLGLVNRETTFESLDSDSLDILELAIDAEDVYDIDLVDEDPKALITLGDFADMIERAIKRKEANAKT